MSYGCYCVLRGDETENRLLKLLDIARFCVAINVAKMWLGCWYKLKMPATMTKNPFCYPNICRLKVNCHGWLNGTKTTIPAAIFSRFSAKTLIRYFFFPSKSIETLRRKKSTTYTRYEFSLLEKYASFCHLMLVNTSYILVKFFYFCGV